VKRPEGRRPGSSTFAVAGSTRTGSRCRSSSRRRASPALAASSTPSRLRPWTSSAAYSNAAMVPELLAGDAHGFLERGLAAQHRVAGGVAQAPAAREGVGGQRVLVGTGTDQLAHGLVDFQRFVDAE